MGIRAKGQWGAEGTPGNWILPLPVVLHGLAHFQQNRATSWEMWSTPVYTCKFRCRVQKSANVAQYNDLPWTPLSGTSQHFYDHRNTYRYISILHSTTDVPSKHHIPYLWCFSSDQGPGVWLILEARFDRLEKLILSSVKKMGKPKKSKKKAIFAGRIFAARKMGDGDEDGAKRGALREYIYI